LLADPASQAELFLARFAAGQDTAYLSSERAPTTVTSGLRSQRGPFDDLYTVTQLDHDAPVVDAIDHLDQIPENGLFVIDPIEPLERVSPGQFRTFLESPNRARANERRRTPARAQARFDALHSVTGQSTRVTWCWI